MLETLFGNVTAEKVLFYIQNYGEGYGQVIAETFSIPLNAVQNQLKKLELGGILVSQLKGRTRVYTWNPRFLLRKPLQTLLEEALALLPEVETKKYYRNRNRPRRAGKPL